MTALSGNVYFTTVKDQERTLIATVVTPSFPKESYFNLITWVKPQCIIIYVMLSFLRDDELH